MSFTAEEYSFLGAMQAETKEEALEAVTEAMPLYQNEEDRCFFRELQEKLKRVSDAEYEEQVVLAYEDYLSDGYLEGEWISFPTTPREMERLLSRIGVESAENMSIPNDAFFIANFATDLPGDIDRISQFDSLEKLNYLAGRLEEMDDRDFARFTQALHQRIELPESGIDGLINLTFNLNQIWLQPEAVRVNGFSLRPMLPEERLYAYGQSSQLAMQTGSIGRLRGDMDWSGDGFFTSWE